MIIIVRFIAKSYWNFLKYIILKLHMLSAAPLYAPVKWQWSVTLWYFLSFKYFFQIFLYLYNRFCIFISLLLIFCYWFHIFLKKWIIFIASSLKDSQIYLRQSLPLYTLCLFSFLVIDDIVDIRKPDGMCSTAFVKNEL